MQAGPETTGRDRTVFHLIEDAGPTIINSLATSCQSAKAQSLWVLNHSSEEMIYCELTTQNYSTRQAGSCTNIYYIPENERMGRNDL